MVKRRMRAFSWEPQTKAIRANLAKLPFDRLARADIEALFAIGKHAAQRLMRTVGAENQAGALFVDRRELQRYLAAVQRSGVYARDESRRERVRLALNQAGENWELKTASTGVKQREFQRPRPALPDTVHLAPGRLTINFANVDGLKAGLVGFAQWLATSGEEIRFYETAPDAGEVPLYR